MTPYAEFLFFRVSLVAIVPAILQGLAGWRARRLLIVTTTLAMVAIQYAGPARLGAAQGASELWLVAAYAGFEWAVVAGFFAARREGRRPWLFRLALVAALLPLGLARWLPLATPGWHLGFLGISYVTLRSLDVLICAEDGLVTRLSPVEFLSYLLFFPTISAGPIDRYRRFSRDWAHERTRAEFLEDLDQGIHRIVRGFLYKFILAALIRQYWLEPAALTAGVTGGISYMYAYSLYLFFDFAGYSAFAIGFSYVFGIHTPENFRRPFLAPNIREFWNRWHVSLSWWLRDHVYMRFVMTAAKRSWFSNRHLASHVGIMLALGLMGLWHGTQWQYLLYGLYHGALLVGHDVFSRRIAPRLPRLPAFFRGPVSVLVTFHAVAVGFLLFSGRLTGGTNAIP
jgi:membrane protein involved in D-alanine export